MRQKVKIFIENYSNKSIEDDGAIAIGYAIRKNNTLQTVSITSDKHSIQHNRRHWSTRIGYRTIREHHTHIRMHSSLDKLIW